MRYAFALLLLIAAAVHPVIHVSDEALVCPCAQLASIDVAAPAAAAPPAVTAPGAALPELCIQAAVAATVPARAPPAV